MIFEFLNKACLRGIVGRATMQTVHEKAHCHFSLCTNYCYKDVSGCAVYETTWFYVSVFEGDNISKDEILKIQKGSKVEVLGRFRIKNYTNSDGDTKQIYEVAAAKVHVLSDSGLNDDSILPKF